MNENFVEYLNTINPNQETILVATRAFISEITDDLLPSEMKDQMISATKNANMFESEILQLESSAQERLEACLNFLAWAWENQTNRQLIQAAFEGAAAKLPAIETGLLALIAMYGMYLVATGGRRKEIRKIRQKTDGTFEEEIITEWESPTGTLLSITKLFGINKNNEQHLEK